METAGCVHDALLEQLDQAARDLGLSRGELTAEALRLFLRQTQITGKLDKAHDANPAPAERRLICELKSKLPVSDAW